MGIIRLDHCAFRVENREKTANLLKKILGYQDQGEPFDIDFDDGTKAKCCVLEPIIAEGKPEIFISDGEPGSIVANWVKEHGENIHHLAWLVDNVEQTMEEWKAAGVEFSTEKPIKCEGLTQIFTKEIAGVVFELIERETVGFCQSSVKQLMIASQSNTNLKFVDNITSKDILDFGSYDVSILDELVG